ncbi:hypothetical protein SDC9_210101 [bioreactor metagenome]|uniref:Uncharacterized protein n=1 Tax=bioreactor metagenome TaxID=1076179 RepID=A0A645JQ18_9ZZZZ
MELTCQISTPHDPDVPVAGCSPHACQHGPHIAADKTHIGSLYQRQLAAGEDPGRLRIRPGRAGFPLHSIGVADHPLIGGRAHGQRTDLCNKARIAGLRQTAQGKQLVQGVVLGGKKAVQAGSGVVLGLHDGL